MPITAEQMRIVKSTVPILEKGGEALTNHFYKSLFSQYPITKLFFNQSHQASGNGTQPRALAQAVLCYAKYIDKLEVLSDAVSLMVQKHCSLQVMPEHYPIVGKVLLQSIREVVGAEIATDEVLAAWGAAYFQLADLLISAEKQCYDATAATAGGWRGARQFKIARRVEETKEITSFYLEPVDGKEVLKYPPGQYIGVELPVGSASSSSSAAAASAAAAKDGEKIRRNYSLSQAATGTSLRISVKRERTGTASVFLHDKCPVGTVLDIFPPAGDFIVVDDAKTAQAKNPLVLIGAGVGVTPLVAMLQHVTATSKRPVTFLQYSHDAQAQPFKPAVDAIVAKHSQVKHVSAYTQGAGGALTGRVTADHLKSIVSADADVFVLGPTGFMATVKGLLKSLGVPDKQARFEFFGPAEVI